MNLLTTYAVHTDLDKIAYAVQSDPDARVAFTRVIRCLTDDVAAVHDAERDSVETWAVEHAAWLDAFDTNDAGDAPERDAYWYTSA